MAKCRSSVQRGRGSPARPTLLLSGCCRGFRATLVVKTMKTERRKCVAPGLFADPDDCWVRGGCKYWSKLLERCTYGERPGDEQQLEEAKDDKVDIK